MSWFLVGSISGSSSMCRSLIRKSMERESQGDGREMETRAKSMKCKIFETADACRPRQKVGKEILLEEAVFNFPKWFQSSVWRPWIGIKLYLQWWSALVESLSPLPFWSLVLNFAEKEIQEKVYFCIWEKSPSMPYEIMVDIFGDYTFFFSW